MILDGKEYAEWKNQLTTKKVLSAIDTYLEHLCISIGQGSTLSKEWKVEETAMRTSYEDGKIAGMTLLGNLDFLLFPEEEEEEKKEEDGD